MPQTEKGKQLCVIDQRHAEYYGMQKVFDELYDKSKKGEIFTDLKATILKRENILLAYRNIKRNTGSNTAGTDGLTIREIAQLTPEAVVERVRFILGGSQHGYRPKPVRRKEIPKPNGKTRPLGIPCIWDRLIQQCIRQVMEPICEAKFSDNSYGFRPNRSAEQAIARTYSLLQRSGLHYVVEFDIKGFFDNVNHSKLIKQVWALGIRDKWLIDKIQRILKAPIKMPDGTMVNPEKGTPQGGIISPLLANIVLNELDHWVESQWQEHPLCYSKWKPTLNTNGSLRKPGYRYMRLNTNLKEMWLVRYADDFRIFCRTRDAAEKTRIAVTMWLVERLKLEVSPEKTRTVNVSKRYTEFLGFKMKLHRKAEKMVVKSNISDKQLVRIREKLVEQAKRIASPRKGRNEFQETELYNEMVMGIQFYYSIATHISADLSGIQRAVMTVLTNRLYAIEGSRLRKEGRPLTETENKYYGKSRMLRYVAGVDEPIYPIGYVRFQKPVSRHFGQNVYSPKGRIGLHDNLKIDMSVMRMLRNEQIKGSMELFDNRLSLLSAQWGKCAITGELFTSTDKIICYRKSSQDTEGADRYNNLMLIKESAEILLVGDDVESLKRYIKGHPSCAQNLDKINAIRISGGLNVIAKPRKRKKAD